MKRSGLVAVAAATVLVFSLRQDLGAAPPANSAETYKQLNLFGEVFERVRAEYVDEVSDDTLVEVGDQRHADLARSPFELSEHEELQRHEGPDPRRVRRARDRGVDGERARQGGVADRRYARPRAPG